jgi:cyclophilin family peptidyl-prolyl cis-trans isomerase
MGPVVSALASPISAVLRSLPLPVLLAAFALSSSAQDGIYADFTTSMGSFTCRLEYAYAPKAVANFIGLATGERAWLDLTTGKARTTPFYDGLIFHRVITNFMNQGGSPNKQGTDGPGYTFQDEFTPSLRHTNFGVLSMANSGPDANGAQFFITTAPTTWLNDVHTIFGQMVGGSNVVYAINRVATDGNNRPLTEVVIQKVGIRRVGTAAQSFDIHAQGLPVVTNQPVSMAVGSSQVSLTFSNRLNAENLLYSSTNLVDWTSENLGIETTSPIGTNSVTKNKDAGRRFHRMVRVEYTTPRPVPKNVYGRTLVLTFTGGADIITVVFDGSGGGSYNYNGSAGTVTSYSWNQDPYRGRLQPIYYSGLYPMALHLNFATATSGSFSGTVYDWFNSSVSGTYTITGP